MTRLANVVYTLGLAIWAGGMAFFMFALTPMLFSTLPDQVGSIVGQVFPYYYGFGLIASGVALIAAVLSSPRRGKRRWSRVVIAGVLVVINLICWLILLPQMDGILVQSGAADSGFKGLHSLSMELNILAFVLAVWGIVRTAWELPLYNRLRARW